MSEHGTVHRLSAAGIRWWWPLVGGALLAAVLVIVVSALAGARPYTAVGNPDPGPVVMLGTPLLRLLADLAATVCVGALTFAASCTRPQPSGLISAQAYGELRIATHAALVWGMSALLLVPFSAADTVGLALSRVIAPGHLLTQLDALEQPKAWLITAAVAAMVAAGCRAVLSWRAVFALGGLAVIAVLPPLATAHGSSDSGHDLALAAIVIHVPTATLWIGTALAVLRQVRRGGLALELVMRRYARLARWCWVVLVASGLVLGVVLVPLDTLLTSDYGVLLLTKVGLVAFLGVAGEALRRRAARDLDATPPRWPGVIRLGCADILLLLGVLGMSVDLTHLSVPNVLSRAFTTAQTLLGYDLSGPPTPWRLITAWRVDMLFSPAVALLAVSYLVGVRHVHSYAQRWPMTRTAAWLAGCLTLLLATSSGLGRYAAAMFSLHMASHMLISMLVPALFVLGAPLTLLDAAAPQTGSAALPGLRDWLETLRASQVARALTHPVVTLTLFAGSPFALYFTGLFDAAVRFHWAHLVINAYFLVIGYLFLWSVIGVDTTREPLPNIARLGILLAAMPADIVFAAALINTRRVIGNGIAAANFYQALKLPWVPNLLADQRFAGMLALAIGELTLFVVMVALLLRWSQTDSMFDESSLDRLRRTPVARGGGPGHADGREESTCGGSAATGKKSESRQPRPL
ncbi:MAG: bifunctional copper resistance protein CopD/cytochrome c oxidase assembly protein [Pseudonocardiales bacterium]|nr:bifunctional copper resistance protein CopD/cytochrome c oxidase assembly protein [Pseudonocardiales bacterium]